MNIKITMMSKRSQKRAHTVLNLYKTLESADKASVTKRPTITLGWGGGNADRVGRRRVQDSFWRVMSVFNTLIIVLVSLYVKSY